ncbi:MAG TPA: diaminopimelate decarboxylase [Rhodanobacter sp.]|nr:diaminopimelate decarboxylase [Rhodanobacter sp.]
MTFSTINPRAIAGSAQVADGNANRPASTLIDGVDPRALARHVSTPAHLYSAGVMRERLNALKVALADVNASICYAVKANSSLAILQWMNQAGVGADIVSAGELERCLRAGMPPSRIVFSGVGKTEVEIATALEAGISRFNVESVDELHSVNAIAGNLGVLAHAAVRINPDVDARTHAKISTGKAENKFGVSIAEARSWFARHRDWPHARLDGLHVHIGSQIQQLDPFVAALQRVAAFWRELEHDGHAIASIDVGGGLGVRYRDADNPPAAADYVGAIRQALAGFRGLIVLEPGRWLIAEAGMLLTRVIRIKHGESRNFLVLDAAMNDLARPSLYDAWHDIVPVVADPGRAPVTYDIVGPVCESGDTFARDRVLPECRAGELLLIRATGAYGASMSSTYNSRPLAAEVLLDDGCFAVIRRAQTFEEMTAGEQPATDWVKPGTW